MADGLALAEVAAPVSAAPVLLKIERVHKRFVGAGGEVEALRDVSLEVARSEFVCLIGASGCGKSTLLRLIGGFEAPSEGRILLDSAPVRSHGPERGMVFQETVCFLGCRSAATSNSVRQRAVCRKTRCGPSANASSR